MTYTRERSLLPDDRYTLVEEVFQIGHGDDGIEEEANEMWNGDMRDAIGCEMCYLPVFEGVGDE